MTGGRVVARGLALSAILAPIVLAVTAQTAFAQGLNLGGGANKQPVEILADQGIEWDREAQRYVARGNASARQEDTTIYGDVLTAYYRGQTEGGTSIFRYEAQGRVRIVSPTQTAVGDKGVYDIDSGVVVLTGQHLKLTTPNEVVTARDSLEYWDVKRVAVARGDAVAVSADRRMTGDILTSYFVDTRTNPPPPGASGARKPGTKAQPAKASATGGNDRLQRIEGFGNVHVSTPTEIVRGDRGVYNADTGIAMLSDHVRITRDQNQLDGDFAEVNLNTGISRLLTRNDGTGKAQVRGLLVPQSSDVQKSGDPQKSDNPKSPQDTNTPTAPPTNKATP
jgi:lipopolysaccharide export system protein LptA